MNAFLLIVAHLVSLAVAVAVLYEYRRLVVGRAVLLTALGKTERGRAPGAWLIVGYLLSLSLVAAASAYIFFLPSP